MLFFLIKLDICATNYCHQRVKFSLNSYIVNYTIPLFSFILEISRNLEICRNSLRMKLKITLLIFNIFSIVFFTVFHIYFTPQRQISSIKGENIKVLKVDFKEFIKNFNYISEKSNQFKIVNRENIEIFQSAIKYLISQNLQKAFEHAFKIKYELYNLIDENNSNKDYFCLIPSKLLKSHQGIFCYNKDAKYSHHIAAPHPLKDSNTNLIAAEIFRENSFKFFSVASAHRCSSIVATNCSGKTSVCGNKEAYRVSDLAHNPDNYFHKFSTYISDTFKDSIAIQIHGCEMKSCPSGTQNDVVFRLSTGTKDILNKGAISNKLNSILNKKLKLLKNGAVSRSCNNPGEVDYKLCATTNIQGRYINGQKDNPCQKRNLVKNTERFLHIETNNDLRSTSNKDNDINSKLLINAIKKVLK